jgi:hypothetical protein
MITQIPFQMGTKAQHKKNEPNRVSGNLGSCQANKTVTSKMAVKTPHITLRYWMIGRWEWECLEMNPTMDALQFDTLLTNSLIAPLTFKMTSF